MAHAIESRATSPVNDLRDALDKAERQIVKLEGANVEEFLMLLDQIEQRFENMAKEQTDVRPEEARWESLLNRLSSTPGPLVKAAKQAGGLAALRQRHPPAESFWWQLDVEVAKRRLQTVKRTSITVGAVVLVLVVAYWAINYFFPPSQSAVLVSNTTAQLDTLIQNQDWKKALAIVTPAQEQLATQLPGQLNQAAQAQQAGDLKKAQSALELAQQTASGEFELLTWKGVLSEQAGDTQQAQDALAEAHQSLSLQHDLLLHQAQLATQAGDPQQAQTLQTQAEQQAAAQPTLFWTQVGNTRLQVGNLDGAEQAARQALANSPDDAQATFLLGSVAESKGDNATAIELFNRVFELAQESNPQLAVIARVRMGNLMQRVEPFPQTSAISETGAITQTTPVTP